MYRFAIAAFALALCCSGAAGAQQTAFTVDGNVAISSLVALGDGHLKTMADTLETLAATDDARSGDWTRVVGPLRRVAETNVPAVLTFARPDGTYWTLAGGRQSANIADRPYFKRAMSGEMTIGDLVTSRSSGKPVAIVAVPIKGNGGSVVGVLGAAVFLDSFSALIAREMGIGSNDLFWAIDENGKIAIHSDSSAIFLEPAKMTPELRGVLAQMLAHDQGTLTYVFLGRKRTVLYRTSKITGWRYGFGVLH